MDTSNILFIAGGHFKASTNTFQPHGKKRTARGRARPGMLKDRAKFLKHVDTDDILKFGMIPELIGRFPIVTALEPLDEAAFISILTQPKNALVKQYKKFLELEGATLNFEPDSLRAIANKAEKKGTGARGLRSVIEELMLEIMYEIPSRKDVTNVNITKEMVERGTKAFSTEPKPVPISEARPVVSEERRESA
jgi:ATP-dependent Clp protease ATP-binding subunit ClpX